MNRRSKEFPVYYIDKKKELLLSRLAIGETPKMYIFEDKKFKDGKLYIDKGSKIFRKKTNFYKQRFKAIQEFKKFLEDRLQKVNSHLEKVNNHKAQIEDKVKTCNKYINQ